MSIFTRIAKAIKNASKRLSRKRPVELLCQHPMGYLARLKHFKFVLENVPEDKFTIDAWMQDDYFGYPRDSEIPKNFKTVDCKTAGCAFGWAAIDNDFMNEGLGLSYRVDTKQAQVYYRNSTSRDYDLGAEFFGITYSESKDLFAPSRYEELNNYEVKPHHVIEKLIPLIKKYSKIG